MSKKIRNGDLWRILLLLFIKRMLDATSKISNANHTSKYIKFIFDKISANLTFFPNSDRNKIQPCVFVLITLLQKTGYDCLDIN